MGLDMYLYAEKYVSNYDFVDDGEKRQYTDILKALDFPSDMAPDSSPHAYTDISIGYWRKANQIHSWFIRECANGVDDCQRIRVDREKLEELLAICHEVLANPNKANELLPPQEGFFFGSYDIDSWYMSNIEDTIKQLEKALTLDGNWEFAYRASW